MKKSKGLYEKVPGSGVWWIRYADTSGRIRREKAGARSAAFKLYQKRKTEVLEGKKLPEQFRAKPVSFEDLSKDALDYSKAHKVSYEDDVLRMAKLVEVFGSKPAESITPQDIEKWFATKTKWKPATCNRFKALVSLVYRLGVENGKVKNNPARLVKHRRENNARTRYLLPEEEVKLREAISQACPERLPEFEIALHTGMRRSEQYGLTWDCVNLELGILTIPRSKHGEKRHVYLNDAAKAALNILWRFSGGTGKVFANLYRSDKSKGPREWFEAAVKAAGIKDFTWHCLRHTFASRLVMLGTDIRTLQELMGHKTIQITLRYAHLAPQHQLAAVQRLCDTGAATKEATDTKTSTRGFGHSEQQAARPN